ncbi:DUF3040 domain-containing protein [Nocardioides sp.]|uniref:DUF3040 domain-containing protein n=1 Tax=Nocardioides sp. TaxID=35761 RepID=UPI002ED0E499
MPLSEEELRLLEQMERALVEEDPKFASTLRGTSLRSVARRRAVIAGVVFVIGVAVMMTGLVMQWIPIGIGGFVVMLASATVALSALRGQRGAPADTPAQQADQKSGLTLLQGGRRERRPRRTKTSESFMERMEERWRRRRESGGF